MSKLSAVVAGIIGVFLGVVLFLSRKHPSPSRCRSACPFSRDVFFTAMIVSVALSSLLFTARSAYAQRSEPAAVTTRKSTDRWQDAKEWQELRALWALITGSPTKPFEDPGKNDRGGYVGDGIWGWKYALLQVALKHRFDRLDALGDTGPLSETTRSAVERLFRDMIWHFHRSNCGATCYMPGSWQKPAARGYLEQQAVMLRRQFRKGNLEKGTLDRVRTELGEQLRALGVLGDFMEDTISPADIEERIAKWRKEGRIKRRWIGEETYAAVVEEIRLERVAALPDKDVAAKQSLWKKNTEQILSLTVDLSRYPRSPAVEAQLIDEISGQAGFERLTQVLTGYGTPEVHRLVSGSIGGGLEDILVGLSALGKEKSVPLIKPYLTNEVIQCSSRSVGSSGNAEKEHGYLEYIGYPIREVAARVLKPYGVDAPTETDVKTNTTEGRRRVRRAFESKDPGTLRMAAQAAGDTEDKSFIPLLLDLVKRQEDADTLDAVVWSLAQLGKEKQLKPIFAIVRRPGVGEWYIRNCFAIAGPKQSATFLRQQILANDLPAREAAARILCLLGTTPTQGFMIDHAEMAMRDAAARAVLELLKNKQVSGAVQGALERAGVTLVDVPGGKELRKDSERGL